MNNLLDKIKLFVHILKNMGLEYVLYKGWYMFLKRSGLMKIKFPIKSKEIKIFQSTHPYNKKIVEVRTPFPGSSKSKETQNIIDLWKETKGADFFPVKENLKIPVNINDVLKKAGEEILKGEIFFFHNKWIWLGKNYDWVTNPETSYTYDISQHWSDINELDPKVGDIKYVWEKSRFTYLLTLIRYDYHLKIDCGNYVVDEILSWIESNPVNCGPNWVCSQEMSLRLMNWFFALHYYKNHPILTESNMETILQSVYNQIHHVYSNIKFSLKTVRNNHALTESLLLFLAGHLFPLFKDANQWKIKGKKWFEQEIDYQIYPDGSYIQYSMNYHRVAIQLLTLGIMFSEKVHDPFGEVVYDKAKRSLNFLFQLHNKDHGFLPNYGNNDGALFFPLNDLPFSDFRPQLNALHFAVHKNHLFDEFKIREDAFWLGADLSITNPEVKYNAINRFEAGGYYTFRDDETLTFLRCGRHENRPGQADNLHLNISLNGQPLLRDAGTYQYNGDPEIVNYFFGTGSHNTVLLEDTDQMKKSGRFIWLYWSQSEEVDLTEDDGWIIFQGKVSAFRHIGKNIQHHRTVRKKKKVPYWEVEDLIVNKPPDLDMVQVWHPNPDLFDRLKFNASTLDDSNIPPQICEGMFAQGYGSIQQVPEIRFNCDGGYIKTKLSLL